MNWHTYDVASKNVVIPTTTTYIEWHANLLSMITWIGKIDTVAMGTDPVMTIITIVVTGSIAMVTTETTPMITRIVKGVVLTVTRMVNPPRDACDGYAFLFGFSTASI